MEILVVGKNCIDDTLVKFLEDELGHRLETVMTGSDALRFKNRKQFDLVLVDPLLPDMKGHNFVHAAKKIWAQSKFIAITESYSREVELELRREGVIHYIIKPIDRKYLENVISHISKKYPGINMTEVKNA